MINEKELEISNISYTNKDFGAIYTEILDLAKKLSSLWSPQSSDESDPGVVLLKLLAFVADKLNYNIDKNTLEGFMPSATQESSMRKLCDMMGYYMQYYKSAETEVTFTYKGDALDYGAGNEIRYMTFPKFITVVSNNDSSIQYFLLEDLTLNSREKTGSALALEGYLNTLNIGDSNVITLDNLDSQNRVYFGESQVAQNGVIIKLASEEDDANAHFWKCVDNLNVQDPGASVFKFGYDSNRGMPYVEFPADISTLIKSGLSIRYVVTSGYYGNVGVGNLNKLLSPTSVSITGAGISSEDTPTESFADEDSTKLIIKNNLAALNGSDPETIDSAYNNFKKTVGTFETLVTCRDYANYIYSKIIDASGKPVVSNCQAADRRLDINKSQNIVSYNTYGQYLVNTAEYFADLFLYPLKPVNNPGNESEYKESFKLIETNLSSITDWLESDDSPADISYQYHRPDSSEIGLIKILYALDAKITTTYKVNIAEQLDIKRNILQKLRETFYSRNIDYGYEIPYETIYNCILNADKRIKSVVLKEPDLSVQYLDGGNDIISALGTTEPEVDYTDSPYLKILAKDVMAGRVHLFDMDDRFSYEFGMGKYPTSGTQIGPVLNSVESFYSTADITLGADSANPYVVKDNEVIQVLGPKLVDEIEYGTYINYWCNFDLYANVDTKLGVNDKLLIVYTDSSQNQIEVLYKEGDIVKSTFDIDSSDFDDESITKNIKKLKTPSIISALGTDTIGCLGIPTKSSIFKRKIVRHTFNSNIKVSWLVSDIAETNILNTKFSTGEQVGGKWVYECILGDSDYFIYSLDGESSYEIFGSGTSLRVVSDTQISNLSDIIPGNCEIPNLNDLFEFGIEALTGLLKTLTFTSQVQFVIQVNDILTLATGDKAYLKGSGATQTLTNTFETLPYELEYELVDSDAEESLVPLDLGGDKYNSWRIRSRLDLVCGSDRTQILASNQTIIFKTGGHSYPITYPGRIRSNLSLDIAGGGSSTSPIPLNLVDPTGLVSDLEYPVSLLIFTDIGDKAENFPRASGYWVGDLSNSDTILSNFATGYSVLVPPDATQSLVMCYISFLQNLSAGSVTITGYKADGTTTVTIKDYSSNATISTIPYTIGQKLYILSLPADCAKLKITVSGLSSSVTSLGSITLGTLNMVSGLNSRFKLAELEEENNLGTGVLSNALITIIKDIDNAADGKFYYMCKLDPSEEIEEDDLSSPYAFFDANNMASRFAISYIDLDNSSIEITRSSKL